MSEAVNLNIGINVDEIHQALDDVAKETEITTKKTNLAIKASMAAMRKTTQLAILMTEAIFGSLDAVLRYAIEGAIQTAELFTTIMTAEAFTNPLFILKAGAQFASIVAIYMQISNMVSGRAEMAEQSGRWSIFLRSLATSF